MLLFLTCFSHQMKIMTIWSNHPLLTIRPYSMTIYEVIMKINKTWPTLTILFSQYKDNIGFQKKIGTKPHRKNNDKRCTNKMQVDLQVCKLRDIKLEAGNILVQHDYLFINGIRIDFLITVNGTTFYLQGSIVHSSCRFEFLLITG